jgi:hypothetical protein
VFLQLYRAFAWISSNFSAFFPHNPGNLKKSSH